MNMFIGLAFYLHAKSTCMAVSFQQEGKLGPIFVPIQQSEQSCNLFVKDIDFTFSYDFIRFFSDVTF